MSAAAPQSETVPSAGTVHLHPQAGDNWREWPDEKAARSLLNVNSAQMSTYLRRGYIVRYKCPDLSLRFNPAELEMLRLKLEAGSVAEVSDLREANVELKEVLRTLTNALKQAQTHNEKLFELITSPIEKGTQFVCKIVEAQNTRLATLEGNIDDSIQAREALLSLQHDRDLRTRKAEMTQENIRHAVDTVSQAVGPLALHALSQLGLPGLGKKHPAVELLESFDPAMVSALWDSGIFTDVQKQKIREVWPEHAWPADVVEQPPANENAGAAQPAAAQPAAEAAAEPAPPPPAEPAKPPEAPPAPAKPEEPPSTKRPPRRRRKRPNTGD